MIFKVANDAHMHSCNSLHDEKILPCMFKPESDSEHELGEHKKPQHQRLWLDISFQSLLTITQLS